MITLIFATHNGEKTLPSLLDALCAINVPNGGLKIIAVDNASTDASVSIIDQYRSKLPITLLSQPLRGKNKAINIALPYIEGDLVVFTDDDIVPAQDWLESYESAAQKYPNYQIFGGSIRPSWPRKPDKWILEKVNQGVVYAATNPALKDEEVPPRQVWGGNMMIRSELFNCGNRFNEEIGPSKGNYTMGSETEFTARMHKAGCLCRFVPEAKVFHIIRDNQLDLNWILGRAIKNGKSEYEQTQSGIASNVPRIFGIPRWVITKAIREFIKAVMRGWKFSPDRSFASIWNFYRHVGYISAHIQNRKL